jgi:hypothetical protein
MTRISASHVLRSASALIGQPFETSNGLDTDQFGLVRALFDLRLREFWNREDWPDLVRTELRRKCLNYFEGDESDEGDRVLYREDNQVYEAIAYANGAVAPDDAGASSYWIALPVRQEDAETWVTGTDYVPGNVVFYPTNRGLYVCKAATSSAAPTTTGFWHPLAAYDPAFPSTETWHTQEMGQVISAHAQQPEPTNHRNVLQHDLESGGVRLEGDPGSAWFRYRLPAPQIFGLPLDTAATSAAGDQVYYLGTSGGDFWNVLGATSAGETPASAPAKFSRVEIPAWLSSALARATYADWLRSNGKLAPADAAEAFALDQLGQALDTQRPRQTRRTGFTPG